MAKKKGYRGGKDKGKGRYHQRAGLGRLRRAAAKSRQRTGNLERLTDEHGELAAEPVEETGHTGENLLAKFNRLTRNCSSGSGAPAQVCGFEGARVLVRSPAGEERLCEIRQVLKKMLAGVTTPICVGDRVRVQDDEVDPESGVITAIEPRANQLARADSHNKALVHTFAANVDRLVIVASLAMPNLKPGLIDRYLTIAHYNDIEPLVVLNKADLADPGPAQALYEGLGYRVVTATAAAGPDDPGANHLRDLLHGLAAVFAGQSGVGKSSLVTACYPDLDLRIGQVSSSQRKGRHTTTASRSYAMADGTTLIDTPGIRECALTGLEPLDVALLYPDIAAYHHDCRFHNCSHRHEPGCAVLAAVDAGDIAPSRYLSYCSIVEEDLGIG